MKKLISSNQAVSHAVVSCRPQVVAAYPITPQSSVVEMISNACANNDLQARFINVESEHSAMAACIAASATGARTFTATSSQGLALMHELLHYASGLRLPIVMANVNRALAAPFNLKADLSDSLSQRDAGWIQFYCESGQEVFDTIIQSYRISEQVLLPVMVNLEGFILSHTYEIVDIPKQDKIDSFVPPSQPWHCLDVENPFLMGATTDLYINFRYKMHQAMEEAKIACKEIDKQFERDFERGYGLIQPYHCEDADIILVTAGSIAGTCRVVSDRYRKSGLNIGVLRIRLFRPFPKEQICQVLEEANKVAVIDRDFSPGCGGIIAQEVKSALQGLGSPIPVYEYISGLGGQDVTIETVETIVNHTRNTQKQEECKWMGLLQ